MSIVFVLVIAAIIVYFLVQKPHDDGQERAGRAAAEIAKAFGDTTIEPVEFECEEGGKKKIYVVFERDGLWDKTKQYKVIETVYDSDSENELRRKARYADSVLQKLPYSVGSFSGYAYTWEKFLKYREHGTLRSMHEENMKHYEM